MSLAAGLAGLPWNCISLDFMTTPLLVSHLIARMSLTTDVPSTIAWPAYQAAYDKAERDLEGMVLAAKDWRTTHGEEFWVGQVHQYECLLKEVRRLRSRPEESMSHLFIQLLLCNLPLKIACDKEAQHHRELELRAADAATSIRPSVHAVYVVLVVDGVH